MYKKMLVTLDGSELAEVVLTYVKELAGRLDMEVVLLQVGPPNMREFEPMQQAYIQRTADTIKRQIKAVRKKIGAEAEEKPVKVESVLATGQPADQILNYAEENNIDLIIMASHGRSGIGRWAIGSVADKVLRASKIPIWLVRAGVDEEITYDKWPKMTILVPLDGTELAESTLPHVEMLAKQPGIEQVEVVLMRVYELPSPPAYYAPELSGVPVNWAEYTQQEMAWRKKTASEYLDEIEQRFKDKDINVRSEVLEGKATELIVDYASNTPYSVVVMATHHYTGFHRWVYGSVSEHVVFHISNPVLLIGPDEGAK